MAKIYFTVPEKDIISHAMKNVTDPWDCNIMAPIRKKLRIYLLDRAGHKCCYCLRSLRDDHALSIDIEHILPKGKNNGFPQHTVTVKNLSVSCKRCNMRIKNQDLSFFTGTKYAKRLFRRDLYKFIHPNIDNVGKFLVRFSFSCGDAELVKYYKNDKKGNFHYSYFELDRLEKNSLNKAQGINSNLISETISAGERQEIIKILGYGLS